MSDLTAFLLARLAEDEAAARAYDASLESGEQWGNPYAEGPEITFQARFDPARVLAQVGALRAVVELHSPLHECNYDPSGTADPWTYDPRHGSICPTLRALAQVWASHPAFDPAWSA